MNESLYTELDRLKNSLDEIDSWAKLVIETQEWAAGTIDAADKLCKVSGEAVERVSAEAERLLKRTQGDIDGIIVDFRQTAKAIESDVGESIELACEELIKTSQANRKTLQQLIEEVTEAYQTLGQEIQDLLLAYQGLADETKMLIDFLKSIQFSERLEHIETTVAATHTALGAQRKIVTDIQIALGTQGEGVAAIKEALSALGEEMEKMPEIIAEDLSKQLHAFEVRIRQEIQDESGKLEASFVNALTNQRQQLEVSLNQLREELARNLQSTEHALNRLKQSLSEQLKEAEQSIARQVQEMELRQEARFAKLEQQLQTAQQRQRGLTWGVLILSALTFAGLAYLIVKEVMR